MSNENYYNYGKVEKNKKLIVRDIYRLKTI